MPEKFPLELIPEIEKAPEKFRLLRQVPEISDGFSIFETPSGARSEKPVVFIDLETTGLNPIGDKVIQLAMVKTFWDLETGQILRAEESCDMLEDPGRPLPRAIKSLTGLSDSDLKNQSINDGEVGRMLADKPLVVAHNASFDRAFFDKRFPALSHLPWGCTLADPNWRISRFKSRSLEQMVLNSGYFFSGHNAMADVCATIWLMLLHPDRMLELLNIADAGVARIDALGSPFETKDQLKQRGYRWNSKNRYWSKEISANELEEEKEYLNQLYGGGDRARITRFPATSRFR